MKMKKLHLIILVLIIAAAMLACGSGDQKPGNKDAADEPVQAEAAQSSEEEEPVDESQPEEAANEPAAKVETEFPLLPNAENVQDLQGTITYQSKTSLADAFEFYRKELTDRGLKENSLLTLDEDDMFQFVFEGSANGKQLVVQTLKLDDKTINVTVRYEELNN